MPNLDGGHYFLTTLIPLKTEPVQRSDGTFTSPSHILREALATMPTAQQSPAAIEAGYSSPFSRCTRTHFVRMVVIDQPMYNGRDAGDTLVQGLRNVNLLVHQPVDNLSCPYLMFCADFDARADEADGGLASWVEGLWTKMEKELRVVFNACREFEGMADGRAFHAWLKRCQIETTMSFNDYYVPMPDLHGYTLKGLGLVLGAGVVAVTGLACWWIASTTSSWWWLLLAVPVALVASLALVFALLWRKGRKSFPAGADTDLPSVLKSLHVQQRFALLAASLQGADAATVRERFGQFVAEVRPDEASAPTQPPGVIRSDGVPLVKHRAVPVKSVVAI